MALFVTGWGISSWAEGAWAGDSARVQHQAQNTVEVGAIEWLAQDQAQNTVEFGAIEWVAHVKAALAARPFGRGVGSWGEGSWGESGALVQQPGEIALPVAVQSSGWGVDGWAHRSWGQ